MKKITQNFYQVKANKVVLTTLCLIVAFCMGVIGQANAQSSIYFTQFAATPTTPTTGTASWTTNKGAFNATTSSSPFTPSFDNVTYPNTYTTTGSEGFVTLNFSAALTLTDNGTSKGKIIVHWGSVSNRPLNISINGATAITIDNIASSAERNKVRTAIYDLPADTPDVTSIKFISSGGGGVSVFDVDIQTYAPLATDSFKADSSANVYSNGNQVFVANVKSNTTVTIYGINGSLVKTVEATADTSFELASGIYVAKVKSAEGEKSVKLLMK